MTSPRTYLHYVGLEAGAAFIRQFQIGIHTWSAADSPSMPRVVTAVGSVDPDKSLSPVVELRLRRRSELAQRETKPRQYFVIDEAVIRRHVGIKKDRTIMPNQLRSIAERAEQDDLVTVRVIPFESGAHPGLFDSFTLLEFDGGRLPDVLYLDVESREQFTMIAGGDPQAGEVRGGLRGPARGRVVRGSGSIELDAARGGGDVLA